MIETTIAALALISLFTIGVRIYGHRKRVEAAHIESGQAHLRGRR